MSLGNPLREAQLAAKEENLRSPLKRIGKFDDDAVAQLVQPIRATRDAWGYRNKIELAPTIQNGRFRLGLHGRDPKQIIHVDACPLFEKKFPRAIKAVSGALGFLGNSHDLSLERVGIRASRRTRALEVALWTPTGGFPRGQVSRVLSDALPSTSMVRVMSKGEKKARRVSKVEVLSGEGSWTEDIADSQMRLSAPSFFQVNTKAAEILIDLVMDALNPRPEEVAVDLTAVPAPYASRLRAAASTSLPLRRMVRSARLRRNLEINHLDNVDVIGGDAVREFLMRTPTLLVVDPPRAGLAHEAIDLIANTSARDVAYVSCDPATLARDLKRFCDEGTFVPVSITPVDLFPQTFHCEAVTHLTRK